MYSYYLFDKLNNSNFLKNLISGDENFFSAIMGKHITNVLKKVHSVIRLVVTFVSLNA